MNKFSQNSLLPIRIIRLATQGDSIAMQHVITHYRSYILRLSSQNKYESNNKEMVCVDEYMRRQLETKLIEKVLTFDVTR